MSDILGGDLRSQLSQAGFSAEERPAAEGGAPVVPQAVAQGPTSSGHHAVDAAIRAVDNAAGLSAQEQIAAYEAAHRTLREVLTSIEE